MKNKTNFRGFAPIIILILLVLVGGVYYFGTLKNKIVPVASVQPSSSPLAKPTADPTANWNTHATSKYLIKYPSDWKVFSTPLEGEALFQIEPTSILEGENYPSLFIEFKSNANTSLKIQEGIYLKMGLSKLETTFNGQAAIKYSGMSLTKNVGGKIVTGTIQQTFIIFEKAGYIYTIGYSYDNNQIDQKQETFFGQILSTFKFTK